MIPKIRNILYATDLSKNSAFAFRYAVKAAEQNDAKIHILHVLEKLTPSEEAIVLVHSFLPHEELESIREEKRHELVERINKRLSEFAGRELEDNPEALKRVASTLVIYGDPTEEILKKADELNCDLIVMGTHGKGLISHTFLGSVSEKVLHRTRKPVFIVPIPRGDIDISFRDI
jgi:nucleotide-binding universal stress UspA family protein